MNPTYAELALKALEIGRGYVCEDRENDLPQIGKMLIVEDDPNKLDPFCEAFESVVPIEGASGASGDRVYAG